MGVVPPTDVTVDFGDGSPETVSFSSIAGGFEAVVDNVYTAIGTYTVNYTIDGTTSEAGEILITPTEIGNEIKLTGTTNLAVDDQILVEVMSSSVIAVDKTPPPPPPVSPRP